MADTPSTAIVDVKPAMESKINWTQIVSVFATVTVLLSGGKWNIGPDTQLILVAAIQGIQGLVTVVLKTWFTASVTPSAIGR